MFEGSLVESTALLQTRNRWPALLSFGAQAVAALVIIAVPMLHPELLPLHAPSLSLTPPPPPPRPPQTPPPPQHIRAALISTDAPSAPSAPPARQAIIRTLLPANNSSTEDTAISTMVGPNMGNANASTLSALSGTGNTPSVSVAPPAAPAHAGTVRLSQGVTAGLLINPIRPDYPSIAKAAHAEGTVVIRAIISRSGEIERAQVISGPVMLQNAALEAVEHARYHPYLLNGQPTEVDTTVTITFHLGS